MQGERPKPGLGPTPVAWSGLVALMMLAALAAAPGPTFTVMAHQAPVQRDTPRDPAPPVRSAKLALARAVRDLLSGSSLTAAARSSTVWASVKVERSPEHRTGPSKICPQGRIRPELLNIPPPVG